MFREYVFLGSVLGVLATTSIAETDDTALLQKHEPAPGVVRNFTTELPPASGPSEMDSGRRKYEDRRRRSGMRRAPNEKNRVSWQDDWMTLNGIRKGWGMDMRNVHEKALTSGEFPQYPRMAKAMSGKIKWKWPKESDATGEFPKYNLLDYDGDGISNTEDGDVDGDFIENKRDAYPWDPFEQKDSDGDGMGNNQEMAAMSDLDNDGVRNIWDLDIDGDRVANIYDDLDFNAQDWQDSDNDNIGDKADAFPDNPAEYHDQNGNEKKDDGEVDVDMDGIHHELGKAHIQPAFDIHPKGSTPNPGNNRLAKNATEHLAD